MRSVISILFILLFAVVPDCAFSWTPMTSPSCTGGPGLGSSTQLRATTEDSIIEAEERLREAMINSNVKVLDALLDDDLVFTNHLGMTLGKQDDLDAHRQELVDIRALTLSDLKVRVLGDDRTAIVTVAAHIIGSFMGDAFEDTSRFTRVWQKIQDGGWKIVGAHSSVVAQPMNEE